jgi:hypothetical protein
MTLKIMACRHVYSGTNGEQQQYNIFEIDAAKPDGQIVNEKLRSFVTLPIGELIEVTVTPFESEKYGKSFTLYPKGQSRATGNTAAMNRMREELDVLQATVATLAQRVGELEHAREGQLRTEAQAPTRSSTNAELDAQFGGDAPW